LANTATRTSLPVPLGSDTTPRTIWSAWRGSTPRFIATSTVSSNLAVALALTSDRLIDPVEFLAVDRVHLRLLLLAELCHRLALHHLRPIARALPSMILVAASMSLALRSFIFVSAISDSCERLIVPALPCRLLRARLLDPRRLLQRKDAGGVLVSKEKLRSA
jgi:hypothetical protein